MLVSRAAVAVHVITATTDTTVKTSRTVFEAPSSFTDEMTSTAISSGRMNWSLAPGRDVRADADAGDRAEQHAAGEVQREVPEDEVTERGGADERDRLHEVGADELLRRQRRVEQHQRDDHQRPRPDRGHADDQPADDADDERRHGLDERPGSVFVDLRPPGLDPDLHHHPGRGDSRTTPRIVLMRFSTSAPPRFEMIQAPANALGTEPMASQRTSAS